MYELKFDLFFQNGRLNHGKKDIICNNNFFRGLILLLYTKQCQYIGIDKYYFKIFHQNNINKVMGIEFIAKCFGIMIENVFIVKKLTFINF